jgi:hypothetical protein
MICRATKCVYRTYLIDNAYRTPPNVAHAFDADQIGIAIPTREKTVKELTMGSALQFRMKEKEDKGRRTETLRSKKKRTQNPEDESERKRQSHPFSLQASETDKPGVPVCGLKRCTSWPPVVGILTVSEGSLKYLMNHTLLQELILTAPLLWASMGEYRHSRRSASEQTMKEGGGQVGLRHSSVTVTSPGHGSRHSRSPGPRFNWSLDVMAANNLYGFIDASAETKRTTRTHVRERKEKKPHNKLLICILTPTGRAKEGGPCTHRRFAGGVHVKKMVSSENVTTLFIERIRKSKIYALWPPVRPPNPIF